jgi:hypothetical protein
MFSDLIRQMLVVIHVIARPHLVCKPMSTHPTPNELSAGTLFLVKDGDYQKWACFRCPCGCGEKIQLSLNPARRPRWAVTFDWLRRPTVTPSVRQLHACRSHFWIKRGNIEWCGDSGLHQQ